MKNFKKLALMGLTAVMSLSLLAGCGNGTTGTANREQHPRRHR